jgi:aldehyde dehydrogenase (NAD+)
MREIELAVERLPEWMKDESGVRDTPLGFKMNNPRIKKQPKGVGLIISPWNYPWFLVLGPMTGAIAAGAPFVIKVSLRSGAFCSRITHFYFFT